LVSTRLHWKLGTLSWIMREPLDAHRVAAEIPIYYDMV
jgi:hypothetical protein